MDTTKASRSIALGHHNHHAEPLVPMREPLLAFCLDGVCGPESDSYFSDGATSWYGASHRGTLAYLYLYDMVRRAFDIPETNEDKEMGIPRDDIEAFRNKLSQERIQSAVSDIYALHAGAQALCDLPEFHAKYSGKVNVTQRTVRLGRGIRNYGNGYFEELIASWKQAKQCGERTFEIPLSMLNSFELGCVGHNDGLKIWVDIPFSDILTMHHITPILDDGEVIVMNRSNTGLITLGVDDVEFDPDLITLPQ